MLVNLQQSPIIECEEAGTVLNMRYALITVQRQRNSKSSPSLTLLF